MAKIKYDIELASGGREVLEVCVDSGALHPDQSPAHPPPPWTDLQFHKCENCPLRSESGASCPVARKLVPIAERFGRVPSYERVIVHVSFETRVVSGSTTAQKALGSLIGLVMPLSGCPRLAPLAPMARFHLPLSSSEETIYRVVSMYLLTRYFSAGENPNVVTDLDGLNRIYADIRLVNQGIAARLRNSGAFAELNSLAILDLYAQTMPMVIEDSLEDIRHLFRNARQAA